MELDRPGSGWCRETVGNPVDFPGHIEDIPQKHWWNMETMGMNRDYPAIVSSGKPT
jgi:hypothetical protein